MGAAGMASGRTGFERADNDMNNPQPDLRAPSENNGLLSLLATMASLLRLSHQRSALISLLIGLVGVIGATAYAQVKLNA